MSLTTTTLASACGINDTVIVVAASTGFTAGYQILVDQEVMQIVNSYTVAGNGVNVPVLRGQNGTVTQAHPSGANVNMAAPSDTAWGSYAPQSVTAFPIAGRARVVSSYSAAGAITLPPVGNDAVAIINGTTGLAMTVADPSKDQDGSLLFISSNGAATTTTITFASGLNGAGGSYDVLTLNTGAPAAIVVMAVNGVWMSLLAPAMTGTVTNLTGGIA